MAGCLHRCAPITATTYSGVWYQARDYYGPRPLSMSEDSGLILYNQDFSEYADWLSDWNSRFGGVADTPAQFGKWLNWRLSIGTSALNNLPTRKRDHVGISCIMCPYDSKADPGRTERMLGIGVSRVNHDIYYMKVAQRGSVWGFECTYDGCPYYLLNGVRYFYV